MKKVLIANRGEIVLRIISTCKRLGLRTAAIYAEGEEQYPHAQFADEAFLIQSNPNLLPYLDQETIIKTALDNSADIIHPGYGFLSENADFAAKVEEAGLIFVGAPADVIRSLAEKDRARALAKKAGVSTVPGYDGKNQDPESLFSEAKKIGFPLAIKASFGGGGKGLKIVENESDFTQALESAKREAANAFSNDHVILESFLNPARHIEVQLLADQYGKVIHLFERDCSAQRRRQKIIEETPAPGFS